MVQTPISIFCQRVSEYESMSLLNRFHLQDGVYICAAFSSLRVNHCFIITVSLNLQKKNIQRNAPLQQFGIEWIAGVRFARHIKQA